MANNQKKQSNGSGLDFEAQFWAAADRMGGHMNPPYNPPFNMSGWGGQTLEQLVAKQFKLS